MEDEAIIELYFNRNESAIEETSNKYGKYCHIIANNILKSIDDSEECVNETYLNTWNTIPPSRPSIFKAFLGKITRNIALNMYKKEYTKKRKCEAEVVLDELEECVPSKNTIEIELEEKELSIIIDNFLLNLPNNKRVIMVERYWYLYSIKDISKKHNLGESNIKMILARLRKDLRDYLEKEGVEI